MEAGATPRSGLAWRLWALAPIVLRSMKHRDCGDTCTGPDAIPRVSKTMANRTTQTVVCFPSTFLLPNFDAPEPAGNYRVDDDEESIDGAVAWLGWRRVGSFIHLPAIGVQRPTHQMVPVNPADLDAALERDHNK